MYKWMKHGCCVFGSLRCGKKLVAFGFMWLKGSVKVRRSAWYAPRGGGVGVFGSGEKQGLVWSKEDLKIGGGVPF